MYINWVQFSLLCTDHAWRTAASRILLCARQPYLKPDPILVGRAREQVNTASRMESTSVPMRTQISEPTAQLLLKAQAAQGAACRYTVESRGLVSVKGKGEMRTWWLVPRGEVLAPVEGEDGVAAHGQASYGGSGKGSSRGASMPGSTTASRPRGASLDLAGGGAGTHFQASNAAQSSGHGREAAPSTTAGGGRAAGEGLGGAREGSPWGAAALEPGSFVSQYTNGEFDVSQTASRGSEPGRGAPARGGAV